MRKRIIQFLFLAGVMFLSIGKVVAASDPFPLYECLKPNVEFWKKIFTRYSSNQGVLHDSSNVSVIYEVVDLVHQQNPNSRKINEKRIRESKMKYESVLEKLGREEPPCGPEENRIAALFGPAAAGSDFLAAKKNLRCQIGQMDRFREGVVRSGAFLEEIKQIFQAYGLPADLAYLPHVESSFNHNAYSRFGAAGMWQFMRSTGIRFMEIGYTIDERRDPVRSSHAAAKLLKENYETLGDWPTAITAYNHGLYGMLRAKQSLGCYEEIFRKYESRLFQFASRNFYSEFLAAREVAKNYRHYFGELELDKPVKYREIVLAGYVPVLDLVRNSDFDVDVIRHLNPALREPVYNGQKHIPKGYSLRLPVAKEGIPEEDSFRLAQHIYKPEQKRSLSYTVKRGDTAHQVARIHGIELSQLKSANNLDRKAKIYPGQNLQIPASDEKTESLRTAAMDVEKTYAAVEPEPVPAGNDIPDLTSVLALVAEDQGDQKFASPESITVESPAPLISVLAVVAEDQDDHKFASPESITLENAIPELNDAIKTGEPDSKPSIAPEDLVVRRVMPQNGGVIGVIRTEAEETLGHYADWLAVPTQAIRKLNGFSYARALKIHESVKIPLDKVAKEDFEEKRLEYHKQLQEDFFAAYEIENVRIYRIGVGDNIWTLCREVFDVPIWLVAKYNPSLDFESLKPSRELLVPVVREKGLSDRADDRRL